MGPCFAILFNDLIVSISIVKRHAGLNYLHIVSQVVDMCCIRTDMYASHRSNGN